MRKLLFILALFIVAMAARGQTVTLPAITGDNVQMNISTDYTLTNTTVRYFDWTCKKAYPTTQSYTCLLNKGTGSHTETTVNLYGKTFTGDAWVLIGTGTSGTITTHYDLTIKVSVPNTYGYFRAEITGTGIGTTTIADQTLRVHLQ